MVNGDPNYSSIVIIVMVGNVLITVDLLYLIFDVDYIDNVSLASEVCQFASNESHIGSSSRKVHYCVYTLN